MHNKVGLTSLVCDSLSCTGKASALFHTTRSRGNRARTTRMMNTLLSVAERSHPAPILRFYSSVLDKRY